jgi:hypothetical protein
VLYFRSRCPQDVERVLENHLLVRPAVPGTLLAQASSKDRPATDR